MEGIRGRVCSEGVCVEMRWVVRYGLIVLRISELSKPGRVEKRG